MDEQYDVLICGTGLVECILSGLLSQEKKKVLHIDRNNFYGGEGASLNLTSLWKQFRNNEEPPKHLGANREWNVDLIPKFVMSDGNLVKILLKTRVSRYLEWKSIDGTFVYQMKEGGLFSKGGPMIAKVPSSDSEALKSDLMGLMEKRRCKNFFQYVQNYDTNVPKSTEGLDLQKEPFTSLIKKFDLSPNTVDFIGHAVALYDNDQFLNKPAIEAVNNIKLYMSSMGRYGDSPFLYPVYGLAGIPEGFSRMCAINGGTFMLNKDIDEILLDEQGKVKGVRSGEEVATCSMVICNPTYALNSGLKAKVKNVGKIIRCICIMDHPLPNTQDRPSCQIIIPQKQLGRNSDIYIMMVSQIHQVCKKGYYVAIVSTMVESQVPENELKPAFDIMGPIAEKFYQVSDMLVPDTDNSDNVFISSSYDPSSHFEGATNEVLRLYKKITGNDLDLVNLPDDNEDG